MFVFILDYWDITTLLGQNNTQPMYPNKSELTVPITYLKLSSLWKVWKMIPGFDSHYKISYFHTRK